MKIKLFWFFLALAGISFLVHWNTLQNQFVYDDHSIVETNPLIKDLGRIRYLFGTAYWGMSINEPKASKGGLYRPLPLATFSLNYYFGKLNPWGYHLVNILLNTLVGFLVLLLCLRFGFSRGAAFFSALVFVVLPIHVEVVSDIVGRSELLAAFFMVSAWILALTKRPTWRAVGMGAFCFLCALLSKENSAALLLILPFSDYLLYGEHWRDMAKDRLFVWIVYAGILFLYLEWRYFILGHVFQAGPVAYFTYQSWPEVALTMSKFIVRHYLWPMASGMGLSAEFFRPAIPDAAWNDGPVWLCFIGLLFLIGRSFYSFLRKRNVLAFSVLLFFILLLPVSNLLARIEVIGGERFLYLPSLGYGMAIGLLYERSLRWPTALHRTVLLAIVLVCGWYGLQSYRRNVVWRTDESLFTKTIADTPGSPNAWNGLGTVRMGQGRYDDALEDFRRALALSPSFGHPIYNIGLAYYYKNDLKKSKSWLLTSLRRDPYQPDVLLWLGTLSEKEQNFKASVMYYSQALWLDPFNRMAQKNLALLHCRIGDLKSCKTELRSYLQSASPEENDDDIVNFLKGLP